MNRFRIRCWAVAAMLTFGVFSPVFAQTASQSAPSAGTQHSSDSKSKQKSPRVWTNDDIRSIRTPADAYMDHEAHAEAASAAQKREGRASGSNPAQPNADALPGNADALEKLIAKTEAEVERKRGVLAKSSADVANAKSDMERSELKSTEEIAKVDLGDSQEELKLLRAKLDQLSSKHGPQSMPVQQSQGSQ